MATARPLRADAERNRARVLTAAREVFAERGIDASVDEVARRAGVGVGTLYRRFPDKEALLSAALLDAGEEILAAMQAAADVDDPAAALRATMSALVEAITADRAFYEGVHERYAQCSWAKLPRKAILAHLTEVAERAKAAGALRHDVAPTDLFSVSGLLAKLPAFRLTEQPRLWERYLEVVLDGLAPGAVRDPLPHHPPAPPT